VLNDSSTTLQFYSTPANAEAAPPVPIVLTTAGIGNITITTVNTAYSTSGAYAGQQGHYQTNAELSQHTHNIASAGFSGLGGGGGGDRYASGGSRQIFVGTNTGTAGDGSTAMNVLPPFLALNAFWKL